MTPEERTNLINQLVALSKENMEQSVKSLIEPAEMEHALRQMAENVVEQIVNLQDNERLIVCMATMTKLLVENYILNARLNAK
jgi:hypothetical protein